VSVLAERVLAIHDALDAGRIPHAFGGALAYAYCADEPRGTRDIDINVFLAPGHVDRVMQAMPPPVTITQDNVRQVRSDGQTRLDWDGTPVDLFFDVHDFHREAAGGVRTVAFEARTIPVLGCGALVVFKAMFNRTRDWADIEAMLEARTFDPIEARVTLERLLGPTDEAVVRLAALTDARS